MGLAIESGVYSYTVHTVVSMYICTVLYKKSCGHFVLHNVTQATFIVMDDTDLMF